ncbi:hypothetical protein DES36_11527 [Alkalibaculum bacchi]|uniref:Uncharacterized protein n=1 Tax=Alkalibaculum bacchi TaxID=645887 RepID=A0A366I2P5_9FIRM|nr:hypothetical protein DES36_11527 [Alkalibaculum bacchi]
MITFGANTRKAYRDDDFPFPFLGEISYHPNMSFNILYSPYTECEFPVISLFNNFSTPVKSFKLFYYNRFLVPISQR